MFFSIASQALCRDSERKYSHQKDSELLVAIDAGSDDVLNPARRLASNAFGVTFQAGQSGFEATASEEVAMGITRQPTRFAAAGFAVLAGMAMVPSAYAQASTTEFIRTAPLQKDELFKHAVVWMLESFGPARPFIRVQREELGTIIGKGAFDINIGGDLLLNMPVTYELRIDVRDSRYRMTFSDVRLPSDGLPRSIEYSDGGTDERQVQEHFEQLADSLARHLANPSRDF